VNKERVAAFEGKSRGKSFQAFDTLLKVAMQDEQFFTDSRLDVIQEDCL